MKEINGRLINEKKISEIALIKDKKEIIIVYDTIISSVSFENVDNDTETDYMLKTEVIKFDDLKQCLLQYDLMRGW